MKHFLKQNTLELSAIIIVFVNIFFNFIPILPLVFGLIILSLYRTGVIGAFMLSSYAVTVLLGSTLFLLGITGISTAVQLLLFFSCLYLWIIRKSIKFYNFKLCFHYLFFVLLIFVISALMMTGGDYALIKIKDSVYRGILTLFAFGFFFSNLEKCNTTRIGLYLILYSYLMLLIAPLLNGGSGPVSILDFGYLRLQNTLVLNDVELVVSHQHVGLFATLGCAFVLFDNKSSKNSNSLRLFCTLLAIFASLYSGARQSIVISILLLLLWSLFEGKLRFSGFVYAILGTLIAILIIDSVFSEGGMLYSVRESGYLEASNRSDVMHKALDDFVHHPVFGVGFGHFEFYGRYGKYPHNLFVEILCELGAIGLITILVIVYRPLKYMILNEKTCIFILIVYFLRSMTSGGIDTNIMLFSYIFSTLSLKKNQIFFGN